MGSDQEKGTWTVRDSVLVLAVMSRGKLVKDMPSHFRIVVANNDLALSTIDDASNPDNEMDPMRLFVADKKAANQSTDPTLASGTPPAGQESRHP
jgi:hypothetical protein